MEWKMMLDSRMRMVVNFWVNEAVGVLSRLTSSSPPSSFWRESWDGCWLGCGRRAAPDVFGWAANNFAAEGL